ncbi:hypothetical protein ILUMI_07868 [Ignelater luminosus]|uniref:Uncharacterized protein n=1 Tax=Ignelater luminosus TaxID=2038154 RepID=A0A8K0D8K0_IGNLU|nr:hypothetical protein ILUMI_07868 [Ignelater luminosus]
MTSLKDFPPTFKRSRADASREILNRYFNNLQTTLDGVIKKLPREDFEERHVQDILIKVLRMRFLDLTFRTEDDEFIVGPEDIIATGNAKYVFEKAIDVKEVYALSGDKFEYIMPNLRCCDNDALDNNDSFSKVRSLFDIINKKQCILNRPIRFEYKMWVGCTSNGYTCWVEPFQ